MIAFAESDFMKELREELKSERRQSTTTNPIGNNKVQSRPSGKPQKRQNNSTKYDTFLKKVDNLEENVDKFNAIDLVYYFRHQAEKAGYKLFISNMAKEAGCMKRLMAHYSNTEICAMIEFLYFSEQDYLEKDRLSVGILSSRWVNTVHADMLLWVDDKYSPKSAKKRVSKKSLRGEWKDDTPKSSGGERKSVIGEWE